MWPISHFYLTISDIILLTEFENGQAVADKVRMKGFADKEMPTPATINCSCGETYTKLKLVDQCPNCNMTYAVTPCSADDHQYIVPAGLNY